MTTWPRPADDLLGEGDYYVARRTLPPVYVSPGRGRESLRRNLKLLRGVGPRTEEKLKAQGYSDLARLCQHSRWGTAARAMLEAIENGDRKTLLRCGASELDLLTHYPETAIAFVDIETTGLYSTQPLFLVGIMGFCEDRGVFLRQYLARSYEEEAAVLSAVRDELDKVQVVATYNGHRFDLPYIRDRMAFHGMECVSCELHVDLLRVVRRLYRDVLPDCRLVTVAAHLLGYERHGDIPGALIPEAYHEFVRSRNPALIRPILEHNAMDLHALALVLETILDVRSGGS
ncbi:MAG: ribonuclease H-like domain-containing protein [Firmicutes bacterium]|nr:ribonuclease H-like domain-containing protein [Bacillota bacterium]MDH7495111.1 ribonuclease H-like domain-containing protein [Bacillota bacterium]